MRERLQEQLTLNGSHQKVQMQRKRFNFRFSRKSLTVGSPYHLEIHGMFLNIQATFLFLLFYLMN